MTTSTCGIAGCARRARPSGLCDRHGRNLRTYGHAIPLREMDYRDRFKLLYTETDDGCWEWQGALNDSGYGRFRVKNSPDPRAHRVAWIIENGPIPDDLFVLHHCDNRACVRVSHLFLGTNADNMRDMAEKGRAGQRNDEVCRNGHPREGNTRTTERSAGRRSGTVERVCVICARERYEEWSNRQKIA